MPEIIAPPVATTDIVLLPAHKFFARRIPLLPGGDIAGQVDLATESLSPFPLEQLYYGHVVAPARDAALVFAAARRQFTPEEIAAWAEAKAVFPAFLALLAAPASGPLIRVWRSAGSITVGAWAGGRLLPDVLVARAVAGAGPALVAEVLERSGWKGATIEEFSGEAVGANQPGGDGFAFTIATTAGDRSSRLTRRAAVSADVREKLFLAEQRERGRLDRWLWRGFLGAVLGVVVVLGVEVALFIAGPSLQRRQEQVQRQAVAVADIARAQALSERIEELGRRRLAPFAMLAVLNRPRPAGLVFSRVTTVDRLALEVEAETSRASEIGAYEAALRALPELVTVETRDLRSREGVTSFVLAVTFKPASPEPEPATGAGKVAP